MASQAPFLFSLRRITHVNLVFLFPPFLITILSYLNHHLHFLILPTAVTFPPYSSHASEKFTSFHKVEDMTEVMFKFNMHTLMRTFSFLKLIIYVDKNISHLIVVFSERRHAQPQVHFPIMTERRQCIE